ncbi:acyl-CoA dehydrogenase family protein [Leeia aquatica]|uniref:acyl-CoA dehydrogenase family protein n=1 Tax=Leeia aquatica TaxID=2725557 RepID=UPI0027E54C23|nr:acyl-CoA dehydrogenase family protein [Leeia aquatica]
MLLNEDQRLIRDAVRDYAQHELWPTAAERDRSHRFPREELQALASMGLFGLTVPTEWGGAGLDYLSAAVALEEVAAGDGAISTILSVQNSVVCGPVLHFGTPEQKARFLRPFASGEMLGAFCLTEPQAGSDAAALQAKAVREGDDYLISGSKQFITNGRHAGAAIVFAVTDPNAGRQGITAFIVPTDLPGFEVVRVEDKLGQHCSDTAALAFDKVRVPASLRLGQEGEGYRIALANLESGRIGIAAQCLGMARSALQCALDYARERQSFGKPIYQHQAVQFRLASAATRLEAARQLVWHAASLKDAGQPCLKEAAMAKLFASEMAEQVCSDALQTFGGYGYLNDFPVERIYRDVRVTQIYEGTSDIQRLIIARELGVGGSLA